jgi:pilus assembly protein Flp/PilA
MLKHLVQLVRDDSGAAAVEYGLLSALIAVGIVASLRTVTTNLTSTFNQITVALAAH